MRKRWAIGLVALGVVGAIAAIPLSNAVLAASERAPKLVGYDNPGRRGGDSGGAGNAGDARGSDGQTDTNGQAVPGGQTGSNAIQTSSNDSLRLIGLTGDRRLVWFRGNGPDKLRDIGKVTGLGGDTRLIGIDYRVQDGQLYGVGDRGGIYTINTDNAKATKVSQLTVDLAGTSFDVDFNPAANRLRVISDTGQNLRHNIDDPMGAPATGTTATDTTLTTPPATTPTTGVVGAAYTNNDRNATTATTLFDLNVATDQIVVQSPANQGELAPTGALSVDATSDAGFDIFTTLRDGVSVANTSFASLKVNGRYRLFRVDLLTGRVASAGAFRQDMVDIAIPLDQR